MFIVHIIMLRLSYYSDTACCQCPICVNLC